MHVNVIATPTPGRSSTFFVIFFCLVERAVKTQRMAATQLGIALPLFSSRNLDFGSTVAPSFLFGK